MQQPLDIWGKFNRGNKVYFIADGLTHSGEFIGIPKGIGINKFGEGHWIYKIKSEKDEIFTVLEGNIISQNDNTI